MIFWYFNFLPGTSTLENYAYNNTTGLARASLGSKTLGLKLSYASWILRFIHVGWHKAPMGYC